ncbi:hypothetical protein FB567DRAFT_334019 [Paraphoma chrysanthemicola]|uniref:Uncharacterized protein n=1 Tax=Paraphoma chrysanthemicola TaxID=798071 RepID=A0A8K0W036_9PLEO|nr:hypothetical protein FB567DRAFT_334019 [Paraphoma chrysanthemicola]
MLAWISLFAFLIDPSFWSRIGFLISYVATSFIVLEVLRLIYTDANKREVEKFLDAYSKQRTASPRRAQVLTKFNIDDLERPITPPPKRTPIRTAAATPESDKTLVNERRRRSKDEVEAARLLKTEQSTTSPVRKLRKRSDTLNSSGSGEVRRPIRRHREASPASEAGSKTSSRHASPRPRSREEKERKTSSGLGKLMRGVKA